MSQLSHTWIDPVQRRLARGLAIGYVAVILFCLWFSFLLFFLNDAGYFVYQKMTVVSLWKWMQTKWVSILAEFLVSVWLFVVGTCIGSFLNVAVHRLARGMSLLGPSRCPHCRTPIQVRDNIPVWGWILRGGRCRCCWISIDVRYPYVEFCVGVFLLFLAWCEIALWSINLRGELRPGQLGFSLTLFEVRTVLYARFALHAALLLTLIAAALIESDGRQSPWTLWIVCAVVLVLTMFQDANVLWSRWAAPLSVVSIPQPPRMRVLMELGAGMIAAAAWFAGWGHLVPRGERPGVLFSALGIGCALGWLPGGMALVLAAALTWWLHGNPGTAVQSETHESHLARSLCWSAIVVVFCWGIVSWSVREFWSFWG